MAQRNLRSLIATVVALSALPAGAQNAVWVQQFGSTSSDQTETMSLDAVGGFYAGGLTYGVLGGPQGGLGDGWLRRCDGAGTPLWTRQLGTSEFDAVLASAPDSAGGVYVGGWTVGDLAATQAGMGDAWFARFDASGQVAWIRQFGISSQEQVNAAAPDGLGGVYAAGTASGNLGGTSAGLNDAWLASYDSSGTQVWIRQFGSSNHELTYAAAADGVGGVYLTGRTEGNLGGASFGSSDGWLARYDNAGNQLWTRQIGTSSYDEARGVAPDGAGGCYVCGNTGGALGGPNSGQDDAWIARYDSAGTQLWVRQYGSSFTDVAKDVAIAATGGIFLSGHTNGAFGGPSAGSNDVWVARLDTLGSLCWIRQFGSTSFDSSAALVGAPSGDAFLGGSTSGQIGGQHSGQDDVWLARYDSACSAAPVTYCTGKLNSLGCVPTIAMSSAPSASASSGCALSATNMIGNKFGLFFHGTSGAAGVPFHGGFLCVKAPTKRHAVQSSGGSGATCSGVFGEDFNAYITSGADPALVAGAQVWIQNWSRDPANAFGDSLSNAVTATICP